MSSSGFSFGCINNARAGLGISTNVIASLTNSLIQLMVSNFETLDRQCAQLEDSD